MRHDLHARLREQLDQGLADIHLSLKTAVLLAAGHRTVEIQRRLGLTPKQAKDAVARVREAQQQV